MYLRYSKIRDVKDPERANPTDAGIDFFIPNDFENITLFSNKNITIPSGIKVEIPYGHMGMFADKSGIASKKQLLIGAKIIDTFYDGEVNIDIHYVGQDKQEIIAGMKIAQLIIVPIISCGLMKVDEKELYKDFSNITIRGNKGFGSSGI